MVAAETAKDNPSSRVVDRLLAETGLSRSKRRQYIAGLKAEGIFGEPDQPLKG
jgi:hypothetical protein